MSSFRNKVNILVVMLLLVPAMLLAGEAPYNTARNKKYTICLDAGHGGKDAGAVGSRQTNREKDINLAIVKEIKRLLSINCSDVKTICTRETDVFVELGKRAEIANKAKADLFISVHVNAIPRSATHKVRGVQSYTLALRGASTNLEVEKRENSVIALEGGKYYDAYNGLSAEIEIMRELMQQRDMEESVNFAKIVQGEMVNTGGRKDLGVQQGNFAVLRLTYMPSVLLEVGFISTEDEEAFLMTTEGRNIMARSIYNAIIQYKAKVTGIHSTLVPVTEEDRKKALGTTKDEEAPKTTEVASSTTKNTTTATPQKDTKNATSATTQKEAKSTSSTTTQKETSSTASKSAVTNSDKTVFKIQVSAGSYDLKETDRQFKGYKVEKIKEGNLYKYFYGASTDYDEVRKTKNDIKAAFPNCFIVAYKNGKSVDVIGAIEEWKRNNK